MAAFRADGVRTGWIDILVRPVIAAVRTNVDHAGVFLGRFLERRL
jgi:hypothetical protein